MMRVLFVCLGNICRSPLAEGVFRAEAEQAGFLDGLTVDSAGTGNWHAGEAPDARAIAVAAEHGIDISGQRARQIKRGDFHAFDLILGMDHRNVQALTRMAAFDNKATIDLFLGHATGETRDVADPYFGDEADFQAAYRDIKAGSAALAAALAGKASRDSG
ncbi:MAG: low molecular weight phosphotyrosine protein phosphatase [Roseitalea sp.]|jgi:protein-tyrosine phosphatase|nr:low molecular weight phosphotyrosine protein phosphatase [Roseitalea sp.]MBO6721564.1 low molecular weight phosphotyrosine protein phosphatase [Roseitalea sp.]MBO6743320.1 low molecular weight phosphotyrosine protein phosphatase [Roseitalea sp.]